MKTSEKLLVFPWLIAMTVIPLVISSIHRNAGGSASSGACCNMSTCPANASSNSTRIIIPAGDSPAPIDPLKSIDHTTTNSTRLP